MSEELTIKEENSHGGAKIYISGEIDIYNALKFKEKLYNIVEGRDEDITIDLGGLDYIDSTGLGVFVGVLKKIKIAGNNMHLENLKDNIKKLFTITGLDKLFIIH